jgi:hypothetical protein
MCRRAAVISQLTLLQSKGSEQAEIGSTSTRLTKTPPDKIQ